MSLLARVWTIVRAREQVASVPRVHTHDGQVQAEPLKALEALGRRLVIIAVWVYVSVPDVEADLRLHKRTLSTDQDHGVPACRPGCPFMPSNHRLLPLSFLTHASMFHLPYFQTYSNAGRMNGLAHGVMYAHWVSRRSLSGAARLQVDGDVKIEG